MRQPRCYSIGLCFAAALLMFAGPASAGTVPVTTGLQFQLDAANTGSITKDGSNVVSQWNDVSGNSNNVSASGNPTYIANGIQHQNGSWKPVVRFDGSGDWFQVVDDQGDPDVNKLDFTTESLSIFMVAKNNGSGYFFAKMAANGGYRWTGHGAGCASRQRTPTTRMKRSLSSELMMTRSPR